MSSQQNITLPATGLYTFPNELGSVPNGSFSATNNVVIDRDGVVTPRRGNNLYGTDMGVASTRSKQLVLYKDRIIRHWGTTLDVDSDGQGDFVILDDTTGFPASVTEPTLGTRIKYVENNGNLYFTSSIGIRKISALTDTNLSSSIITDAGGIQALDGFAVVDSSPGWFPGDSAVAYRIVWGYKDDNTNVILGVPSERIIVENPQISLMVSDYNSLVNNLATIVAATPPTPTGTTTGGSAIITTISSMTGLSVGETVTGSRIPANSTIVSLGVNSITLNNNISGSGAVTGVALTIGQALTYSNFASLAISPNASDTLLYQSLLNLASQASAAGGTAYQLDNAIYGFQTQTISAISAASPTQITATAHGFITGESVIISNSNSTPSVDGTWAVTVVDANNFTIPMAVTFAGTSGTCIAAKYATFQSIPITPATLTDNPATTGELNQLQTYYDAIVNALNISPGIGAYGFNAIGGGLPNSTQTQTVDITFTIPQEITTAYFYQIYRSAIFTSGPTQTLEEFLSFGGPDDELRLIQEANPTTGDLAAQSITFHDTVPDVIRSGGANLYTNANSGEGINQANYAPPIAQDVSFFLGSTFYANTITKQSLDISMLTALNLLGNTLVITNGTTSFTYTFASSEGSQQIQVFTDATPAQSIDDTARSMVRVINKTHNGLVYVDYTSGPNDLPGQMTLTARHLGDTSFYLYSSSADVVAAFDTTDINQLSDGTGVSAANPTVITSTGHGLINGTSVTFFGSNSTPSITGTYIISNVTTNTFTIPVNVTVPGTSISYIVTNNITMSTNEVVPNRLYYSKFQQPEAVPLVNFIDVGFKNKAILRILPLRTSLYILTQSGIYILTGTDASNFTITLFDSSSQIKAPDSAVVLNNQIFCLTSQGVSSIGDTGVNVLSRPIENLVVPLLTAQYTNFVPATFAVSYESDRAYLLFTLVNTSDTVATICYRWNTFTSTWTSWDVSKTCGVINTTQDILYLGAADTNFIEKERKSFTRQDNADRSFTINLPVAGITNNILTLGSLFTITVGDVLAQTQYLTISQYNRLLHRLDTDSGLTFKNYYTTLRAVAGQSMYDNLVALANKLDTDPGLGDSTFAATVAGFTSDFISTQEAFNAVVTQLNNESTTSIKTYAQSVGTVVYEGIVETVNTITKLITLNYNLPFIAGPLLQNVHIESSITWSPHHFGDASMLKHVSESTILFQNMDFSEAAGGWVSDLSPGVDSVPIPGQGNGVWGTFSWGTGYWGGQGNSAPFRTFVPVNKQRCRYISGSFVHETALEQYAIFGISFTYNPISSRAYR